MARHKGKDGSVKVAGTEIGDSESFDITITARELDADVQGEDWTDLELGKKSASGTITVLHDPLNAQHQQMKAGTVVDLDLYPVGETTGLTEISGSFAVTEVNINSAAGDLVKATYNIRNKGAVTETTIA